MNCTNPKALFESIVSKPEDLFEYIAYYFYLDGNKEHKEYATSESSQIRSYVDYASYGRCFTFKPTEDMIKSGIEYIEMRLLKDCWIYLHSNGMFETKIKFDIAKILAKSSNEMYMSLDFTTYNMLDIGGKKCETKPGYDQDTCTGSKLHMMSLEQFGCTSPFGSNKEKICKDHQNGSNVMELYWRTIKAKEELIKCSMPCLFEKVKATKTSEYGGNGLVGISSIEYIETKEAYYLYSMLSLIAEVGGYVGLFLGVSVNQVSALIGAALDRFDLLINKK